MTEVVDGPNPVPGRVVVDGRPIEYAEGDSVAVAIVRAGGWPGAGGTLCLAGDCGNCLVEVDGVAYVRSCQVAARSGLDVRRHPAAGKPILPAAVEPDTDIVVSRERVDVVVVGGGEAGRHAAAEARAAGRTAAVLDAGDGHEVVGIYPGPAVVARAPDGMLHVAAE